MSKNRSKCLQFLPTPTKPPHIAKRMATTEKEKEKKKWAGTSTEDRCHIVG
ncbi:unnamed protein product [Rhodiola kirilowii]